MWFKQYFSIGIVAICCLTASEATAQSAVGSQWLTGGLSVTPSLVVDKTGPDVGVPKTAVGGGMRLRFGFQHVVGRPFVMAAEVELGNATFRDSTMAADGRARAGGGFAWQAGLLGRWVPQGNMTGPALGFGLHTFRAKLPEGSVQSLSGDLRAGWYLWANEHFVLAEIGYAVPFLEGLDVPAAFDGSSPGLAEQRWTLHRFILGFSYGF